MLASGNIRFTPDLPKRQLEAAATLSLGSYDRIALWLPNNPLGLGHNEAMIEQSSDGRTALLLANAHGSSLCTVDVAGSFGAAQLVSDYIEADGIHLPGKRRAYRRGPDRHPHFDPLLVSIDISEVRFT